MNRKRIVSFGWIIVLSAMAAVACNAQGPEAESLSVHISAVQQSERVPVSGAMSPAVEAPLVPLIIRHRRRMNIDQLDKAFRRVTNGVGWDEDGKNQLEVLDQTLGKPDYVDVTQEDLSVSTLFLKFLDDAARWICTTHLDAELAALPGERVFWVHADPSDTWETNPEAVVANVQMLLMRYYGRRVGVDAPEMEPWRWFFESSSHVSEDPRDTWHGLCVGLLTHPNFYTY
jgi:hypothetical protein